MLLILRATLLCLLALAIPAQGFAAATRLVCGPAHGHQHAKMHMQQHDAASSDASPTATADQAEARCLACAACCTAAALPAHLALLTAPPLMGSAPLALGPAARPAFVTGGPDRPPRPVLA